MDTSVVVIVWGLAAIALNMGIGRWCRTHPASPPAAPLAAPGTEELVR